MKPTLLILTGPQGSGNHLFSKIFALHDEVCGWQGLLEEYWQGHHDEPFAQYWKQPSTLDQFDWTHSEYFVTSISSPYYDPDIDGYTTPDYESFIHHAKRFANVKIAIIGRDQTILSKQQSRVRGGETLDQALTSFNTIGLSVTYLSQELVYLYGKDYLDSLDLIPINTTSPKLDEILHEDSNVKYINTVAAHWLDNEVKRVISQKKVDK